MFHLIGLREDGKLSLYDSYQEPLTDEAIETICRIFNYTQVLIISSGSGHYARYEYDNSPRLHPVPAASGDGVFETVDSINREEKPC